MPSSSRDHPKQGARVSTDTDFISLKKAYTSPSLESPVDEEPPHKAKPSKVISSDEDLFGTKQETIQKELPSTVAEKSSAKPPPLENLKLENLKKVSRFFGKANTFTKELVRKTKFIGKKNGGSPSADPSAAAKGLSPSRMKTGCVYSEVNRIRENIVNVLEKTNDKTVVFVTPHDDAGNTFLISLLGFNIAYFTKMKTLLLDLNMRRPQLHFPFGLEREQGFTEIVSGSLTWQDAVKDTGFSQLKIITAGRRDNELYLKMTPDFMENMFQEMKAEYDLILMDSSPILNKNRNNVDPVFLSFTCDMVVMVVQDKRTTSDQITDSVEAITRDGGKIDGIVYNRQF